MPIHLNCPNGHALRVKEKLAGQAGSCPTCGAPFVVPRQPDQAMPTETPATPSPPPLAASLGDSEEAAVEWRVTLADGSQFGPTVSVVFAQWIAAGRVPPDALVWRTGWPDWRPAQDAAADLPATLPGGTEAPAALPTPTVPQGATLPPAVEGSSVLPPTSSGKSASEVSYSLRKRREARRRQKFVLGLMVACLILIVMLVVMMLTGPPENAPVVPR